MTKQQDFLNRLKDPNKALLKEAIRYFLEHNENIHAEYMHEYRGGYVVDLMARSHEEMEPASSNLADTLEKFLNEPAVHIRAHWSEPPPFICRTSYFIMKPQSGGGPT